MREDHQLFDWDDVRVFIAAAKAPSFRQAAKELRITAPTLIRRIDEFERRLGTSLFDRTQTGIRPTPAALEILGDAFKAEEALCDLSRKARWTDDRPAGPVRIKMTDGLGVYWVIPQLPPFQRANPSIIVEMNISDVPGDFAHFDADLSVQFVEPTHPDVIAREVGYLHFLPYASGSYLDLFGKPNSLSKLNHHRFVDQSRTFYGENLWEIWLAINNIPGGVALRTNSSAATYVAVTKGLGIGFLPSYASILDPSLVPLDISLLSSTKIWLVYHSRHRNLERIRRVVDWMKSIFDPNTMPWFAEEFSHPNCFMEAGAAYCDMLNLASAGPRQPSTRYQTSDEHPKDIPSHDRVHENKTERY